MLNTLAFMIPISLLLYFSLNAWSDGEDSKSRIYLLFVTQAAGIILWTAVKLALLLGIVGWVILQVYRGA